MSSLSHLPVKAALLWGPIAAHPVRAALSVIAIALGVALGFAVQLIHGSALTAFDEASRELSGTADLVIRAPKGGFDETLYPRVAADEDVEAASPALEVDVRVPGRETPLRVIGVDVFQLARVQPSLLPTGDDAFDRLRADTLFLSPSVATELGVRPGDHLSVQSGLGAVSLRVAGLLLSEHQQIALMDVAAAQWKLGKLGKLTRIDVKLKQGADRERFLSRLRDGLPPGVVVEQPEGRAQSAATATRAYRVNLNVLALVALFTGGLLVLSTQSLSVARRRGELALLRVLGARRADVLRLIVVEATGLGIAGSIIGIAVGWLLAALVLHWTGGDLGSGHFSGFAAQLHFNFYAASLHAALGMAAAVAGSLPPALEAARTPPAQALKSGDEPAESGTGRTAAGGSLLLFTGAGLTLLPAVNELPLFAYASIACLLLGTIVLMPALTRILLARLPSRGSVTFQLALRQLASSPGKMAVSLAAIVAAVSLAVAMAIMVGSFRDSVTGWLERMLPADLYVRAGAGSEIALFTREDQERLRTLKGVSVVEFLRARQVMVDAQRMPVSLMARDFLHADPSLTLPLVGSPAATDSVLPPLWVSEVAAGLYHWTPGMTVRIPLEGVAREFRVAGIWRDYGRQNGALLMDRRTYVAMTGDDSANDAGLWLDSPELSHQVSQAILALWPAASGLETATPAEVRALSLRIFDRSFAVTYGLEAAAVMIGLLALTGSIATQLAARRREFGMLRHVGMTRGQLNTMLIWEGALVNALGIAVGCTLGWLISLILIHVVNRQSFHWSMEMHVPWHTLASFAASLLLLGVLTAAWAGRQAALGATIRAVKEDW